ncbi:MAG: hypothetical protein LBH32_02440 [Dysgonamonadaceae bacterium]|jgi:hypothetical protein|nr:hypothetical protein [Dysgonamonadaceae bacterium]
MGTLSHAEDWLLFPQNIGAQLSIDETTLSDGELYTIVTNKATKGWKRDHLQNVVFCEKARSANIFVAVCVSAR